MVNTQETNPDHWIKIALGGAKTHSLLWLQDKRYSFLRTQEQIIGNPNATKERVDHVTAAIVALDLAIAAIDDGNVSVV